MLHTGFRAYQDRFRSMRLFAIATVTGTTLTAPSRHRNGSVIAVIGCAAPGFRNQLYRSFTPPASLHAACVGFSIS